MGSCATHRTTGAPLPLRPSEPMAKHSRHAWWPRLTCCCCCGCGRRRTWWLLEPAVIRAGPFMYSGIVRRGGNATHVTLGFVFESFRDQVAACDPWCGQLDEAPGSAGLGATAGEHDHLQRLRPLSVSCVSRLMERLL
eukprot:COSAG04_NODE_848_length_9881_cov_5.280822_4_plen_138_part_00